MKCENWLNDSTWALDQEKRSGQHSQKSHKDVTFTYLAEAPTELICTKICIINLVTCVKLQNEILRGYRRRRRRMYLSSKQTIQFHI